METGCAVCIFFVSLRFFPIDRLAGETPAPPVPVSLPCESVLSVGSLLLCFLCVLWAV